MKKKHTQGLLLLAGILVLVAMAKLVPTRAALFLGGERTTQAELEHSITIDPIELEPAGLTHEWIERIKNLIELMAEETSQLEVELNN